MLVAASDVDIWHNGMFCSYLQNSGSFSNPVNVNSQKDQIGREISLKESWSCTMLDVFGVLDDFAYQLTTIFHCDTKNAITAIYISNSEI